MPIAFVRFDVMHDAGLFNQTITQTLFAQRLLLQLIGPAKAPGRCRIKPVPRMAREFHCRMTLVISIPLPNTITRTLGNNCSACCFKCVATASVITSSHLNTTTSSGFNFNIFTAIGILIAGFGFGFRFITQQLPHGTTRRYGVARFDHLYSMQWRFYPSLPSEQIEK